MGYNLYRSRNIINSMKGFGQANMGVRGASESFVHYPAGKRDLNGQQVSGPPVDYRSVHSLFNASYVNTTSNSTILSGLQNLNSDYKIWALPVNGSLVENLTATANTGVGPGTITTAGKFDYSMLTTVGPVLTKGSFPGLTPNCAWFAISIFPGPSGPFTGGGYMGTIYMSFPETQDKTNVRLRDLFYPVQARRVELFIDYGEMSNHNHYTASYNSPNTRWLLSGESRIGTNGYYSGGVQGFSFNDGIWGAKTNTIVDGASLGLSTGYYGGTQLSFGIQNLNSTDSSATTIYFGDTYITSMTSYKCVLWTEAT